MFSFVLFVIPLLTLLSFFGCAGMQVEVRQTIIAPAQVEMPGVRSLAIVDFAAPLGGPAHGRRFAGYIYDLFREQAFYGLIPPAQAGRFLQANRIPPSRFQDLQTVKTVGQGIGADALLFGDLPSARVHRQVMKHKEVRQVGWEKQKVVITDAEGNTRSVLRNMPVYREFTIEKIYRTVEVRAQARLVSIRESRVLWENDQSWSKRFETVKENGVWQSGEKTNDTLLLNRALHQFAKKFVQDLLPRRVLRTRRLALPADTGAYQDLMIKGNQAAGRNHWQAAGTLWVKAMALEPKRAEARANLGVLREGERQFTQALSDYKYAAKQLGKPWGGYYWDLKKILEKSEK